MNIFVQWWAIILRTISRQLLFIGNDISVFSSRHFINFVTALIFFLIDSLIGFASFCQFYFDFWNRILGLYNLLVRQDCEFVEFNHFAGFLCYFLVTLLQIDMFLFMAQEVNLLENCVMMYWVKSRTLQIHGPDLYFVFYLCCCTLRKQVFVCLSVCQLITLNLLVIFRENLLSLYYSLSIYCIRYFILHFIIFRNFLCYHIVA